MKVSSWMTRDPLSIGPDASLEQALDLMDDRDFRHLPVVSGDRLEGIVSERDLLEALGRMPGSQAEEDLRTDRPGSVGEVAHRDGRTISLNEPLDAVAAVMSGLGIGCLPVVDDDRKLAGIVTEMDVLVLFRDLCRSGHLPPAADPEVVNRMSSGVLYVAPDTGLQDAFSVCLARHVRHLPVLDQGLLVGIVSDRDLRAAATSSRPDPVVMSELMATEVETIEPEAKLSDAAARMAELKVTTLPVLRGDEVVGMISTSDVLVHCGEALAAV